MAHHDLFLYLSLSLHLELIGKIIAAPAYNGTEWLVAVQRDFRGLLRGGQIGGHVKKFKFFTSPRELFTVIDDGFQFSCWLNWLDAIDKIE